MRSSRDPAWLLFVEREREAFLDAVTSDADRAVAMFDQLYESLTDCHERRTRAEELLPELRINLGRAEREAGDWRVRFKDRDNYAKLLEAELLPLRRVEEVVIGEQAVL